MHAYWGYGNKLINERLKKNPNLGPKIQTLWLNAQEKIHGCQKGKTVQDTLHCLRVEDNLGILLEKNLRKFKDEDLFILSSACALHDIAKIVIRMDKEHNHGRKGARMLRQEDVWSEFLWDERFADAIAHVIEAHNDGLFESIPDEEFVIGAPPGLFLRELAAIFRLADMLDTSYRRVPQILAKIGAKRFRENKELWLARGYIGGWKPYHDGKTIHLHIKVRDYDQAMLVQKYVSLLNEAVTEDQKKYLMNARTICFDCEKGELREDVIHLPYRFEINPDDLKKLREVSLMRLTTLDDEDRGLIEKYDLKQYIMNNPNYITFVSKMKKAVLDAGLLVEIAQIFIENDNNFLKYLNEINEKLTGGKVLSGMKRKRLCRVLSCILITERWDQ